MVDFEIVDKSDVPAPRRVPMFQWKSVLQSLEKGKAMKSHLETSVKAESRRGVLIQASRSCGIHLQTRKIKNGTGYDLYVWRE